METLCPWNGHNLEYQRPLCLRGFAYNRTMSKLMMVLCLGWCVGGCSGDGLEEREPPSSRCRRAVDHLIELELADVTTVDRSAHRAAMQRALGPELRRACEDSFTTGQVDCVLDAMDASQASACAGSMGREVR